MSQTLPSVLPSLDTGGFSFDYHLNNVAVGTMCAVRVAGPCDSPRSHPGDLMILDECKVEDCIDSDYVLIEYGDKTIIRQKSHVSAILRRSAMYAVGDDRDLRIIRVVGRVIGWIHAAGVFAVTLSCTSYHVGAR